MRMWSRKGDDTTFGAARPRKATGSTRPLAPSPKLTAIAGDEPLVRIEMVRRVWSYIRENGLQDAIDRREILPDDGLRAVFGRDQVNMLTMMGLISLLPAGGLGRERSHARGPKLCSGEMDRRRGRQSNMSGSAGLRRRVLLRA